MPESGAMVGKRLFEIISLLIISHLAGEIEGQERFMTMISSSITKNSWWTIELKPFVLANEVADSERFCVGNMFFGRSRR